MKKNNICLLYIIVAAVCWGGICLVTRPLGEVGHSSMQITVIRLIFTTLLMSLILFVKDKSLFLIDIKSLPLLMLSGVNFFLLAFFYLSAIKENNSACVAAMLLYTNPVWIIILSKIIFKEKVTLKKIVALVGTIMGCALLLLTQQISISGKGVLFGLAAGVSQALYSVFGKILNRHHKAETSTFYIFLFAALASLLFIEPLEILTVLFVSPVKSSCLFLLLVICMTIVPYTMYLKGIKGIPIGIAGILCILEPVVASVVGVIVFHDPMNKWGLLGILVVIGSLFLVESEKIEAKEKNINE